MTNSRTGSTLEYIIQPSIPINRDSTARITDTGCGTGCAPRIPAPKILFLILPLYILIGSVAEDYPKAMLLGYDRFPLQFGTETTPSIH